MNAGYRTSSTNCSVPGCSNTYSNTNKNVKFYSFPNKPHEKDRRQSWINNIKRNLLTKTGCRQWEPARFSRVCSDHFIGNEKSNHPLSPAYNPTVFTLKTTSKRFNRFMKRKEKLSSVTEEREATVETLAKADDLQEISSVSVACQCNFDAPKTEQFRFESTFYPENETSTQCDIIATKTFVSTEEKCVGPDDNVTINCVGGFHGYESLKTNEEIGNIAGLDFERFKFFFSLISVSTHGNRKMSPENKLLLFFMKIKLGVTYCALSVFFGIHRSTVSRTFISVLMELVQRTRNFVFWPSKDMVQYTLPRAFKLHYPNCRVIIDCTEIRIDQPHSVEHRIYSYSQYKGGFTAKVLVGITPSGFVSFLSKSYGGRSSDTYITNNCGILDILEEGDVVLADKGFPQIHCQKNVTVVMPPFVRDGRLTEEEVMETYNVASVRIHVERAIQRIKTYNILSHISYDLFPHLDNILLMCCVLTNLQNPIIKQ